MQYCKENSNIDEPFKKGVEYKYKQISTVFSHKANQLTRFCMLRPARRRPICNV